MNLINIIQVGQEYITKHRLGDKALRRIIVLIRNGQRTDAFKAACRFSDRERRAAALVLLSQGK